MKLSTNQWLKFAGLFTWISVGVALALAPMFEAGEVALNDYLLWSLPHLLYGVAYWRLVNEIEHSPTQRLRVLLLTLLTVAALEVSNASQSGVGGILLVVVAGILPWSLPLGYGVTWLVAQTLALAALVGAFPRVSWQQAVLVGGLYLGYSSFTFVVSMVAQRQARARDELRKVNSELRATQALLAESTRLAERVRISRELHDLVGHHLTALSLNLEVASHLVKGKATEHVAQAQAVAKLLLSDVREVVGAMRTEDQIDLSRAMMSLRDGVPRPRIHMQIPDQLAVADPQRAQVILRCAQEIITNSVKHANADNLWLTIEQTEDGMEIHARDDGEGTDQLSEGNGLLGMGERVRQLGGRLSFKSALGQGFRLDAWLPREVPL